jgi:hypothetical protein
LILSSVIHQKGDPTMEIREKLNGEGPDGRYPSKDANAKQNDRISFNIQLWLSLKSSPLERDQFRRRKGNLETGITTNLIA